MATIAFGIGTGLLFLQSCRWPDQKSLPALTVGSAVGCSHMAAIWLGLMSKLWPDNLAQLFLVIALVASALSVLARQLNRQSRPLLRAYGVASYGWSRALGIALSLGLTLMMVLVYSLGPELSDRFVDARGILPDVEVLLRYGAAAMTLLLARFCAERRLINWGYWGISPWSRAARDHRLIPLAS